MTKREPADPFESTEEQIALSRLNFIRMKQAAKKLRQLHCEAEAIAPVVERWIERMWGDMINAEGRRHVAYKAAFSYLTSYWT